MVSRCFLSFVLLSCSICYAEDDADKNTPVVSSDAPSLPPEHINSTNNANAVIDNLQKCNQITISEDRLSCYDNTLSNYTQQVELNNVSDAKSAWQTKDTPHSYVIGTVAYHINDDNNVYSKLTASMILRCETHIINFFIGFNMPIFDGGTTQKITLSGAEDVEEKWTVSDSGNAIGIWNSERADNFALNITNMAGKNNSETIKVKTKDGKSVSATFDMNGMNDLYHGFKKICVNKI